MKEYTVMSTSGGAIAAGGTNSATVSLDNPGRDLNYGLSIKGDIASADVAVEVKLPGDTESYQTRLKGSSNLTTLDISQGEIRLTEATPELAPLRVAEEVTVTVTNNDGAAGDATVKILQFEEA